MSSISCDCGQCSVLPTILSQSSDMMKYDQWQQCSHPLILQLFTKARQRLLHRRGRDKQALIMNILQTQPVEGGPVSARPSVSAHKLTLSVGLGNTEPVRQKQRVRPRNTHKFWYYADQAPWPWVTYVTSWGFHFFTYNVSELNQMPWNPFQL